MKQSTKAPSMGGVTGEFLDRYAAFVQTSPQGSLFCSKWWLEAVAPGRWDILRIDVDRHIQAAWPIVWASEMKRPRIIMPPLTRQLGILFAPNDAKYSENLSKEQRLMEQLLSQVPAGVHIDVNFNENFTNWLPFYWKDFQQTTRYTYVFENLRDLDAIWSEMRRNLRTEIRKAEKRGIRCHTSDDLREFYEFNERIFARKGMRVPYSFELLQRIDEACKNNAGRRMVLAEDSLGRVHAWRYLVFDQDCAQLLAGGADETLRGSGANCLVDWEMIKFAAKVAKRFSFNGSVTQGIEPYLREFGAKRLQLFRIWGYANRLPTSHLRRLCGRVFRKLTNIVDPQG